MRLIARLWALGGHGAVEGGVLGETRAALRDLLRLLLEDARHLRDVLGRGAAGGQGGDGGLEQATGLEELAHRLAMGQDDQGQRLDQGLHRDIADEGPLPRADLDEPPALQRPERFPHRRAADHELLGEIALGRELIAGLQLAFRDQLLDLADDLLVDPGALDRLDVHATRRWPRRPPPRPAAGR